MDVPAPIAARLADLGQRHVLRFWDDLDTEARGRFAAQLETIDWAGLPALRRLAEGRRQDSAATHLELPDLTTATTPAGFVLRGPDNPIPASRAAALGAELLAGGRAAAILVAGGQGTRLGCAGPKGLYEVGPVSRASLFEILLGRLRAIRRRYGRDVPLAIMTSSATDAATREHLAARSWFGLDPERVLIFRQQDLPALDAATGDLLLEAPDRLALAPDGHGGMLGALARCGGLDWFRTQGVEHVASFQVDNPLSLPLDAEFLGYHALSAAEFSTQVVTKHEPAERVGVVVEAGGRFHVVEYSDLAPALAAARLPDGRLRFRAGSIAVHAFRLDFLGRSAADAAALPLHLAHKAVPFVDAAGHRVAPTAPNAIKFERFIFDLMPAARSVTTVEIDAAEGFAPLKNPPGAAADAPEHVRAALTAHARRILGLAGVRVAEGVDVELDPATIIDAADVGRLVPPGTTIAVPTVVGRA